MRCRRYLRELYVGTSLPVPALTHSRYQMEQYWNTCPAASPTVPATSTSDVVQPNSEASILSEFDHHHLALLSGQAEHEGWQLEMHQYLRDLPADVTKDTDIVKWWQVHAASSIAISNTQIDSLYRTMGCCTPPSVISCSIIFPVKLLQYPVSIFFQLGAKLQQNDGLNLGQRSLKSCR